MPDAASPPTGPERPRNGPPLPFTRVYQSALSAFGESVELVVRTDADWQRAWLGAHPNRAAAPPPAPAVDFAADVVLVVSAGMQPTGGVALGVDAVQARADGGTDVLYTVRHPGAGCMSTQQLTAPVEVVRVARRPGAVHFIRQDRTTPC